MRAKTIKFEEDMDPYKAIDIGANRKAVKDDCKKVADRAYSFAYDWCSNNDIDIDFDSSNVKETIYEYILDEEWETICPDSNIIITDNITDAVESYVDDRDVEDYKTQQRISTW